MKIEGGINPVVGPQSGENRPKPQAAPQQQGGAQSKVELSPLSSSLNKAETAIASTPIVDRARVDEIRQAMSEGRFQVDAGKIADGLINSVKEMLAVRPGR
jgi:negative regulator of flagellin synthesis FlgM